MKEGTIPLGVGYDTCWNQGLENKFQNKHKI